MGTSDGHVRLPIHSIVISQGSKSFEDSVALARITGCYVQDEIDEPVIRVVDIANDEGSRVKTLSQTCSKLVKVGVTSKFNLDHGACYISLADPYSSSFPHL